MRQRDMYRVLLANTGQTPVSQCYFLFVCLFVYLFVGTPITRAYLMQLSHM